MQYDIKFQRRHLEWIAMILRYSMAPEGVVEYFANHLYQTNPNFNKKRFLDAVKGEAQDVPQRL